MSDLKAKKIITKFISKEPNGNGRNISGSTLVIKGPWGIGKTYLWQQEVRNVFNGGNVKAQKRDSYLYLSLYGLRNLADVKAGLISSMVISYMSEARQEKWKRNSGAILKSFGRIIPSIFDRFKYGKALSVLFSGVGSVIVFDLIKNALICIDDFERRDGVTVSELMGLINLLNEDRDCDVCLILNDGQLTQEDSAEFKKLWEKTVDIHIEYDPSPEGSFDIAFSNYESEYSEEVYQTIKKKCLELSIVNIRILYRIRDMSRLLKSSLDASPSSIKLSAYITIVILVWAYHAKHEEDEVVPEFSMLRRVDRSIAISLGLNEHLTPTEKAFQEFDRKHIFHPNRGSDQDIANLVERGYLDNEAFRDHLSDEIDEYENGLRREELRDAWKYFQGSFDNNKEEVVGRFEIAIRKNAAVLYPSDVGSALVLLRNLGEDALANELAHWYVNSSTRYLPIESLNSYLNDDNELMNLINNARLSNTSDRSLSAILKRAHLTFNRSYIEDLKFMAKRPSEEYEAFFRESKNDELRGAIAWCMSWERYRNDSDNFEYMKAVVEKTREALGRISEDCEINGVRVKRLLS
ncbi:MAG: hypothetical protein SH809_02580 [Rhodothermales bacterium]|nr:hypothetical protein [Rhodothermales bacterium]